MKKMMWLVLGLCLLTFGCHVGIAGRPVLSKNEKQKIEQDIQKIEALQRTFIDIKQSMLKKEHLTIEELEKLYGHINKPLRVTVGWALNPNNPYSEYGWLPELYEVFSISIKKDYLPFKAMFYLALENKNYDGAEDIRMAWLVSLYSINMFLAKYNYPKDIKTNNVMNIREYCYLSYREAIPPHPDYRLSQWCPYYQKEPDILLLISRVERQIEKLSSIVGLTDPMLISLREELSIALSEKKWDEAQKIQNLIAGRVKELSPRSQPQMVERVVGSGGQTTVVVQQPSKIQVEELPRYGFSDYARVLSIIGGKTMSSKDEATLKLFDMILGR